VLPAVGGELLAGEGAAAAAEEYEIVNYGEKAGGFENHHGVLDKWAHENISGYPSRASNSPSIRLSKGNHDLTKDVYRDWLFERTGKRVGGKVDWTSVTPQEAQTLTERMFDAAGVPAGARAEYYRSFHRYIHGLE
jgi:hypothetical protein